MIDEDLDAELDRRSALEKRSKAAIVREAVRSQLRPLPPIGSDPLRRMAGSDDFEPAPVDDVVYP